MSDPAAPTPAQHARARIPHAPAAATAAANDDAPPAVSATAVTHPASATSTECACGCQAQVASLAARAEAAEQALRNAQAENAILRQTAISGGGGGGGMGAGASLSMAFKLMDRLKEERDALRRDNAALKARLSSAGGEGKTPLEQLLESDELTPVTRRTVEALRPHMQETLAADLLRWNLRAPTDAHGNPFDINRRAMHIAKKLGGAGVGQDQAHVHAHGHAQAKVDAGADASVHSPVSTLEAEEPANADAAQPLRRKRLVIAKPGATHSDEEDEQGRKRVGGSGSGSMPSGVMSEEEGDFLSPEQAASRAPGSGTRSPPGVLSPPPSLSTSLLSDTNRLIFQEDSPLYRQQLQIQRVRVAQMFARLDSLSDCTSAFARSALEFAGAAEALATQLSKGWDDVETNEVIDEAEARKMEQRSKAAAATAATANGTAGDGTPQAGSASPAPQHMKPPTATAALPFPSLVLGSQPVGALPRATALSLSPQPSPLKSTLNPHATPARAGSSPPPPSFALPSSAIPTSAAGAAAAGSSPTSPLLPPSGEDPLTLGFSMGKLGSIVGCLGQVCQNLGLFMDHLFVTSVRGVGEKYRSEAKASMLLMERVMGVYEEKLSAFLRKKHKDRIRLLSMTNMFGKKRVLDEEHMYICALRREMELRRLDHVEVLNSIATSRKMELVEVAAASFMAFVTFFHEGDFLAAELKREVDLCSAALPRRRKFYEQHVADVAALRALISTSALPMNMAKVFSGTPCLPIVKSAADWVSNMTDEGSNAVGVGAAAAGGKQHGAGGGGAEAGPAGGVGGSSAGSAPNGTPNPANVAADKVGGGANIGHASLIYTIPGVGVAASLTKPAQVQGYLRMQTRDGKAWKRRWHVLEKGQFFYLRESAFLAPRMVVNVLTCGARPSVKSDLDCVFELISPTKTLLYQAESESDMKTWVSVFANSTEYLLSLQHTRNDTEALSKHMDVKSIQLQKHVKQGLLATLRKENPTCAECGTKDPDWISINLGVMICIVRLRTYQAWFAVARRSEVCSGIHRSLGVHVSKVRSIVLDDLETELLDMMVALGNTRVNAIWEATVPPPPPAVGHKAGHHHPSQSPTKGAAAAAAAAALHHGPPKPTPATPREEKEEFIRAKYIERKFLAPALIAAAAAAHGSGSGISSSNGDGAGSGSGSGSDAGSPSSSVAGLPEDERYSGWFHAVSHDDLEGLMTHLLMGCDPDWRNPESQMQAALHHAAQNDAVLATEFLLQNGATVTLEDAEGKTPLEHARACDSKRVLARLQGAAGKKAAAGAAAAAQPSPSPH